MILPIPGLRKECGICYELLINTNWELNNNLEPRFLIGSNTPHFLHSRSATLIVKSHCYTCNHEVTREYREINDRFVLTAESYFSDSSIYDGWHHTYRS